MNLKVKKDELQYYLSLLILLLCILFLPWLSHGQYSNDIKQYISTLDKIQSQGFVTNFKENVIALFLMKKIFPQVSNEILVYSFQIVSAISLFAVLLKFFRPKYVLILVLFLFTSLFLNQFRAALALAFAVPGILYLSRNYWIGIGLIIFSMTFHIFVGAFFLLFAVADIISSYQVKKRYLSLLVILVVQISMILILSQFQSKLNYYFSGKSYYSYFFIFVFVMLFFLWDTIQKSMRIFLVAAAMVCMISCGLPELSARISELMLIMISVYSRVTLRTEPNGESYLGKREDYSNILLMTALAFFTYRYINWFVLDNVVDYRTDYDLLKNFF